MSNTQKMMEVIREVAEYYKKDSSASSIKQEGDAALVSQEKGVDSPEAKNSWEKVLNRLLDFNRFIVRMDCIFNDSLTDEDDKLCLTTLLYYQNMRNRIESTVEQYTEMLKHIDENNLPDNAEELVGKMMLQNINSLKKYAKIIEKGSEDDS